MESTGILLSHQGSAEAGTIYVDVAFCYIKLEDYQSGSKAIKKSSLNSNQVNQILLYITTA